VVPVSIVIYRNRLKSLGRENQGSRAHNEKIKAGWRPTMQREGGGRRQETVGEPPAKCGRWCS